MSTSPHVSLLENIFGSLDYVSRRTILTGFSQERCELLLFEVGIVFVIKSSKDFLERVARQIDFVKEMKHAGYWFVFEQGRVIWRVQVYNLRHDLHFT